MNIHEFQAKNLLSSYGLSVPPGKVAITSQEAADIARELGSGMIAETGPFHALDVKMVLDDNALYRHPELAALRDEDEVDEVELQSSASRFGRPFRPKHRPLAAN
jgi:succinyl-CoA synthetase beta subunit